MCDDCTSIPVLPNLTNLYCERCTNLTFIPVLPKLVYLRSDIISTNKVQKVYLLQKWIRKNFRYWVFKRWIETEDFARWFYSKDVWGGFCDRKRVSKIFNSFKIENKTQV